MLLFCSVPALSELIYAWSVPKTVVDVITTHVGYLLKRPLCCGIELSVASCCDVHVTFVSSFHTSHSKSDCVACVCEWCPVSWKSTTIRLTKRHFWCSCGVLMPCLQNRFFQIYDISCDI